MNDLWTPISNDDLRDNIEQITLRYQITTDCGIALGEPIIVSVQMLSSIHNTELLNLPALKPTMLNPLAITTIRVYNIEGVLLQTYTSTETEQFILPAASIQHCGGSDR